MTFVLITSSGTMALAVKYGYEKNRKMCGWLVLATAIGGLTFVGMQVFEWSKLIHEGVRPWANPFGAKQFGSYFFHDHWFSWISCFNWCDFFIYFCEKDF